jgi:hypothetical protein
MHIYKKSSPKHKIIRCGIPTSVRLHALYCLCNDRPESLVVRVRVRLIKSAAGPTRTKWRTRVEVMNRVPLRTIEAVIFLKLLHIISLALSGRFLKLSLVLFLLPIAWGHMWVESQRRIVCDTIIRIMVRVVAWLFMGITERGGRDVRSCIMLSVVIAITSPFMPHTKWWVRIIPRSMVWTVVIAMAWAFMWNTECCRGVIPNVVVWIVIISMASPFMSLAECLGRVVGDGPIWIVFLAMAWMFVCSSDCRRTVTATIGNLVRPPWPTITWSDPISRNHPQVSIQTTHIPPIYGTPVHVFVQHNFGPNHCHVKIIHHLQLRAGKSGCRMNLKVPLPEMVSCATFGWPFPPWNKYHCLTPRPHFREVFHLDIRLAGSASPWYFGLILPSRLNDAIRILYCILVQFLGPTLRWGWPPTTLRHCLHSHEPKIILQSNDFNTFEYHKFHLNLCKRIIAWLQCKKRCILLNSRSELLEALNLYVWTSRTSQHSYTK